MCHALPAQFTLNYVMLLFKLYATLQAYQIEKDRS